MNFKPYHSHSIEEDRDNIYKFIENIFSMHIFCGVDEALGMNLVNTMMAIVFCHKFNEHRFKFLNERF
jgi:hydroxymethylglutaryl-CoA reductase